MNSKLKRYFLILLFGLILFPKEVFAYEGDSLELPNIFRISNYIKQSKLVGVSNNQSSAKPKKSWYNGIRYSGFVRFYPYYRNLRTKYDLPASQPQGLTVPVNITADDGYLQPMMRLCLEGSPTAKLTFTTELQFNHLLLRTIPGKTDTAGRYGNLYVLFNFTASMDTRLGQLKLIAGGGVNWYRLSPTTLWGYQYRDDMFERYPWEPEGHDFGRYSSYYAVGDIARDQRFGMQATQGFILEGQNLPAGFDAAILYGKTNTTGGFQSYLTKNPVNMVGGKIGKKFGDHRIGYNFFNQYGYTTSQVVYKPIVKDGNTYYVEDNRLSQLVTSVDGRFVFRQFSIFTELGAGSYLTNTYNAGLRANAKPGVDHVSRYKRNWDETMIFEISTKRSLTYLPIKFELFRFGPHFVNNSSAIANTSVEQAKPSTDTPDQYYINYFDGMVTEVGQLAGNRQGINLFTYKDIRKLKIKFDMSIAQEVQNLAGDLRNGARATYAANLTPDSLTKVPFTNSITFQHRLNGLSRSRFAFYERFAGPYNRLHTIFRKAFENIAITDDIINYKKSFNTMDLELKYKFNFMGKELILSSYNNYSSVQDHWAPVPLITEKAFLRYFVTEFMAFYAIHPKVTLVGFWGAERVKANKRTELADANGNMIKDSNGRPIADPNGKPMNGTGYGYGLGIDYNFNQRASLHLRNRWFNYADKSFTQDQFKGDEMTMEFKVFF
jgi:hypothetical protein